MPCLNADGRPTDSGAKILRALHMRPSSPERIANSTGIPLFRVRSGLRELAAASIVRSNGKDYEITEKGNILIS